MKLCFFFLFISSHFLSDRPQAVRMGSITSTTIINIGAPQGCVLSPFLYALYTRNPQIWIIPAEFSSNPNQTHLSMLIRVFQIIRESQVGEFDQGWS